VERVEEMGGVKPSIIENFPGALILKDSYGSFNISSVPLRGEEGGRGSLAIEISKGHQWAISDG